MAYQTTTPTDIDFMYKMPENLMLKAIDTADTNIDKANDQSDLFDKYISDIKALPIDQQILSDKSTNYKNQIDQVRGLIQNDPANYRKYLPKVREISRGLNSDNDLKSIQSRYTTYNDYTKKYDEAAMKGDIDPVLYSKVKQQLPELVAQSAYNPTTKQFGNLNLPTDISKPIDWAKRSQDYIKDMKPVQDASGVTISKDGKWLVETSEGRKYLSPDKVRETWLKSFGADPEAQRWVGQANNYVAKDYGTNTANSAMEAAMNKYSVKEGAKTKITINPWEKEYWTANQKVQDEILKRKYDTEDQADERNNHIAELVGKNELGKPIGTDKKGNPIPASDENIAKAKAAQAEAKYLGVNLDEVSKTVSQSAKTNNEPVIQPTTNIPASTQTTVNAITGKTEPTKADTGAVAQKLTFNYYNGDNKLTPSKVLGKLQSTQTLINQLQSSIDNIPDTPENQNERGANIDALNEQKALLNNYHSVYTQSVADVREALIKKGYSQDDIDATRSPSNIKELNEHINKLKDEKESLYPYDQFDKDLNKKDTRLTRINQILPQLEAQKKKYEKITDDYNKEQDKWYADNSSKTSTQVDYVKAEPTQAKNLTSMIMAHPRELAIIDPETGENMGTKSSGGTKYSLNPNDKNSLYSKLQKEGKTIADVMTITGISKPVPGFGVTATAKLNVDGLDPKKDYLIKIPSDVALSYAQGIGAKDSKQAEIKSTILNQAKSSFLETASSMFQDTNVPLGKQGISGDIPLKTPIKTDPVTGNTTGGNNMILRVIPINVGGQTKYKVSGSTDNGNTFVEAKTNNGIFQNLQEIADMLYK